MERDELDLTRDEIDSVKRELMYELETTPGHGEEFKTSLTCAIIHLEAACNSLKQAKKQLN